ncbi:MAG: prephenate dehydratase domain-containing protein [Methanomicrobiales archaeon]|nr:prephenate dehydratase domain-containing protein [Methanomicrobiales archaeon]
MRIATLGPEGTFSHELAQEFGENEILLLPTIRAVFARVEQEGCIGLVPLENSEAGGVGATMDALQMFDVYIVGELFRKIRHHLGSRLPFGEIRMIYAHPQTHEQCSEFLDASGVEVVHTRSNAESAIAALRTPFAGAVLSSVAAERYSIPIQRYEIQNSPNNITRFILISRNPEIEGKKAKCSVIIDPKIDRVGLLHDLLGVYAKRGINLTRIESRPSKRGMGSYIFFVDFNIGEGMEEAMKELRSLAVMKELGCYAEVNPQEWRSR